MDLLKKHFNTAIESPDGIKKLRELILTLAMQGKLVEQDPNDQPASELLKEIQLQKERLVAEGVIKKQKEQIIRKPIEFPYQLPEGWEWSTFGDVATIERGGSPRPIKLFLTDSSDGLNWIKIGDTDKGGKYITSTKEKIKPEGLSKSRKVFPGDFLLTNSMSFGRPYITQIEGCIHDGWLRISPPVSLDKDYLYNLLSSPYIFNSFSRAAAGAVVQNLNSDKVREVLIPLPPLAEQQRIVTKVDELMVLCDRLEEQRSARDKKRLTVHTAAINRLLEAQDDDQFNTAWQFITRNFDPLYSVKENVAELKKAILTLAMKGKLVKQDPNDQPASELLKEIQVIKELESKKYSVRKYENISTNFYSNDFQLPIGWQWSRISEFAFVQGGKRLPKGYGFSASTTPFRYLTVTNMKEGMIIDNNIKYIDEEVHELIKKYIISKDDIYITIAGTIGAVGIIPPEYDRMNLTENACRLIFYKTDKDYLVKLLSSEYVQSQFRDLTNKMAQPKLSLRSILTTKIPFPPLAEQKRIVTKIDALMSICDNLENQIIQATEKQTELFNAVLAQV